MKALLGNLIGFQLVWTAAVGGAARGWWWAGPLALLAFALWQLRISAHRASDLWLLPVCALLGFFLDSMWLQADLLRFASAGPWPGFAPLWIVSMWLGFGLTLNHSMAALASRPLLAALFGLLGGPLAYGIAAHAWGAVEIADGTLPYLAIALAWAVLTPLLLQLARLLPPRPLASPVLR